jgi:hypothetical protein
MYSDSKERALVFVLLALSVVIVISFPNVNQLLLYLVDSSR